MDQEAAEKILVALERAIPDHRTELRYRNPFQLLVATILSAQCTDERVNRVTPELFARFPTPAALAEAPLEEVEELIRPTGFFRQKARSLQGCSRALAEDFAGRVPDTLEALTRLPGVGRKTANLILGEAFGQPAVVVDTHVRRVANRTGLSGGKDATRVEGDLQKRFPREKWYSGSSRLLLHGRYTCLARRPRCVQCALRSWCEYPAKTGR